MERKYKKGENLKEQQEKGTFLDGHVYLQKEVNSIGSQFDQT